MTESASHDTSGHDDSGTAKYLYVFGALVLLTSASFFTYSDAWPFKATPAVGWAFMMAVSCTKALLVVLFFMHVKYEASWKYVLTIPPAIMAVFLMLALVPDIGLRGRRASEERLRHMAVEEHAAEHEAGHESDAEH